MNILEFNFENWYTIVIKCNWVTIIAIVVMAVILFFILDKLKPFIGMKSIEIDEVSLGIGNSKVTLKYNGKSQEIAYKLWVELSTRKIGLEFEPENDVISEIYHSWYTFFSVARELMKEIPSSQIDGSRQLIELTEEVLNKGLRPHLTKWQAKYRLWEKNNKNDAGISPQEFQQKFPEYSELESDLIQANKQLMVYRSLMKEIAFKKKIDYKNK